MPLLSQLILFIQCVFYESEGPPKNPDGVRHCKKTLGGEGTRAALKRKWQGTDIFLIGDHQDI